MKLCITVSNYDLDQVIMFNLFSFFSIKGPFEIRVVEKPYQNTKTLIARPLRKMIAEFVPSWDEQVIALSSGQEKEKEKDSESKKKRKQRKKKEKYVPHFKRHTSLFRLQQRSLDVVRVESLFDPGVVKVEAVWGGEDEYAAHWEFPATNEQRETEKEKEKEAEKEGDDEEDDGRRGLWGLLGIDCKIGPSEEKSKSPHTTATMTVVCVMEILFLRHEKFLISLIHGGGDKKMKEKKKERRRNERGRNERRRQVEVMEAGAEYGIWLLVCPIWSNIQREVLQQAID